MGADYDEIIIPAAATPPATGKAMALGSRRMAGQRSSPRRSRSRQWRPAGHKLEVSASDIEYDRESGSYRQGRARQALTFKEIAAAAYAGAPPPRQLFRTTNFFSTSTEKLFRFSTHLAMVPRIDPRAPHRSGQGDEVLVD